MSAARGLESHVGARTTDTNSLASPETVIFGSRLGHSSLSQPSARTPPSSAQHSLRSASPPPDDTPYYTGNASRCERITILPFTQQQWSCTDYESCIRPSSNLARILSSWTAKQEWVLWSLILATVRAHRLVWPRATGGRVTVSSTGCGAKGTGS